MYFDLLVKCRSGDVDFDYWNQQIELGNIDVTVNQGYDTDALFDESCCCGHLDIAKWLLTLDGNVYIHAYNDYRCV